ncbi:hypothetical protein FACS1894122_00350 [Alphaproteobacteria bacterium]|nr:hypothetical protein FACS1894122_00030 [Alphaproteobacteria bacterium]GHT90350.1 hypothetical protein FACS1894122_00350 [Alphaproteobacteria bacterium]
MKRLLIGSAVAMMLMAGVDDANAGLFDAKGRTTGAKTTLGHNNSEVIAFFKNAGYAKDKGKGDYIDEANIAIKIQKQFLADLKKFRTDKVNKTNKALVGLVETCEKGWKSVGVALESIQHARKKYDIVPDCDDARKLVKTSTEALLVDEVGKGFAETCRDLINEGVADKKGELSGKWPDGPTQTAVGSESSKTGDDKVLTAIYNLYDTINALGESARLAAEGESFGVVGDLQTEKAALSTNVATLQKNLTTANKKIVSLETQLEEANDRIDSLSTQLEAALKTAKPTPSTAAAAAKKTTTPAATPAKKAPAPAATPAKKEPAPVATKKAAPKKTGGA